MLLAALQQCQAETGPADHVGVVSLQGHVQGQEPLPCPRDDLAEPDACGIGAPAPLLTSTTHGAPAEPYQLKLGLVALGCVTGLIDLWFIPGLAHKQAQLFALSHQAPPNCPRHLQMVPLPTHPQPPSVPCPHSPYLPKNSSALLDTSNVPRPPLPAPMPLTPPVLRYPTGTPTPAAALTPPRVPMP